MIQILLDTLSKLDICYPWDYRFYIGFIAAFPFLVVIMLGIYLLCWVSDKCIEFIRSHKTLTQKQEV